MQHYGPTGAPAANGHHSHHSYSNFGAPFNLNGPPFPGHHPHSHSPGPSLHNASHGPIGPPHLPNGGPLHGPLPNYGGQNHNGSQPALSSANGDSRNPPSTHWQKQLDHAALCRQGHHGHHYARQAAMQQRGHTSAAITIIDPRDKLLSERSVLTNGRKADQGFIEADIGLRTSRSKAPTTSLDDSDESDSLWSVLDMSGMNLRNLSNELFTYTFLTVLYLPFNALTSLPPSISSLVFLSRLDLTGNKLANLPPELGSLIDLRELYLFDNNLTSIPYELGTLHQLDIIGIEGNPLPETIRKLVEESGTSGLIGYLRDSCPVPLPPPDREWLAMDSPSTDFPAHVPSGIVGLEGDESLATELAENPIKGPPPPETFSVLCYNILCEKYATSTMYGYTPSWALSWEYRKEIIQNEILNYSADIAALQVSFYPLKS